ncbi:MAG: alkaline phosphatase D family protein [Planctomycetes bacterium]|nr:alkaline phosphatase D family protein [Planctomycetota bacterium]
MFDITQLDSAIRSEGGVSRRLFLAYGAALAAIPSQADDSPKGTVKFQSNPFTLGVASGDPHDDSVVIWTRLAPKPLEDDGGMPHEKVEVTWVVAADEGMKKVVHKGTADATKKLGHSVHVVVNGLKPDTWYWYQFHCGKEDSPVGRTRTMPDPTDMPKRLQFAFASCQNYEEGLFTAYKHMAKDELDFVIHLGDYIYEFAQRKDGVRKHAGDKCKSLADYRVRHCQYRHDPLLHNMHARCPWIVTWDDHEVEGNYANDISKYPGNSPAELLKHRAHAYQAYYEMMPLRPRSVPSGPDLKLYRTVTFGRLASFKVLDTRQYRTNQPNGDDSADINEAALNPKSTLLGTKQREWLEEALLKSKAKWNVLAQQVMMGMVDRETGNEKKYSMDAWPGYAHERMKLMKFLADNKVSNPMVLSGDVHSNWLNELRVDDRKQETPIVATEFVGTSISSKGNGKVINPKHLAALQSENPFVKFHNDERGYVRCTVTPKEWKSEYQVVTEVEKPGGDSLTRAAFVAIAGKPGVVKA